MLQTIRDYTGCCRGSDWNTHCAQPSSCLRPGVNFRVNNRQAPNDVIMQGSTTLAIVCLGDPKYLQNGRWCLKTSERAALLEKMDTTVLHDHANEIHSEGNDGVLSAHDFFTFCSNPENIKWVIEALPSSAHGLACPSLTRNALACFDKNNDKVLDVAEFDLYIDFLSQLRLRYLQQMALVSFRCYYGRGQTCSRASYEAGFNSQCHVRQLVDANQISVRADLERGSKMKNNIQYGKLVTDWDGWRSDLYYYSANVHPLHGIWACCHNNRLDRKDRTMMELAAMCFCFWMEHERKAVVELSGVGVLHPLLQPERNFRLACVTLPSIGIYFILILLFTTPIIGTVDESQAKPAAISRAHMFSVAGDFVGTLFSLGVLSCTILRVFFVHDSISISQALIINTVYARCSAYVLNWALICGVYFNPFIAWGSTQPGRPSLLLQLADLVGIGQWHMERCKVLLTTLALPEEEVDLTPSISQKIEYQQGCPHDSDPNSPTIGLNEISFLEAGLKAGEMAKVAEAQAALRQVSGGSREARPSEVVKNGNTDNSHSNAHSGVAPQGQVSPALQLVLQDLEAQKANGKDQTIKASQFILSNGEGDDVLQERIAIPASSIRDVQMFDNDFSLPSDSPKAEHSCWQACTQKALMQL